MCPWEGKKSDPHCIFYRAQGPIYDQWRTIEQVEKSTYGCLWNRHIDVRGRVEYRSDEWGLSDIALPHEGNLKESKFIIQVIEIHVWISTERSGCASGDAGRSFLIYLRQMIQRSLFMVDHGIHTTNILQQNKKTRQKKENPMTSSSSPLNESQKPSDSSANQSINQLTLRTINQSINQSIDRPI